VAKRIGYPVVVRPSYVLGGRAMEIVYSDSELERYMKYAVQIEPDHPILIDKFLENAIEVDVDALSDATETVVIGGLRNISNKRAYIRAILPVLSPIRP